MKTQTSRDCGCGDPPRTPEERIDPEVKHAIDQLRPHEKKILDALARPETRERFMRAPGAVLEALGLRVPSVLRHHLGKTIDQSAGAVTPPAEVLLPNGQRIKPRVRVRFTGSKAGG